MIKKLKLRYLITNMTLLSGTLLIFLGVLFGFLYHAEINSSYKVMQQMLDNADMPRQQKDTPSPTVETFAPELILLDDEPQETTVPAFDPEHINPWDNPWATDNQWNSSWTTNDWYNPWIYNPWIYNPWAYNPWYNGEQSQNGTGESPYTWSETQPYSTQPAWGWWVQTPEQSEDSSTETATEPPKETQAPSVQEYHTEPRGYVYPYTGGHYYGGESPFTGYWQQPKAYHTTTESAAKTTYTEANQPEQPDETPVQNPPEPNQAFVDIPDDTDIQETPAIVTSLPVPRSTEPMTQSTAATVLPIKEGQFVPNAMIAQMDENGNLASYAGLNAYFNGDEDFKKINKAMDYARQYGPSFGILNYNDDSFRIYVRQDSTGAFQLILLDRTLERSTVSKLIFIFLLIGLVGIMIMFGISLLLANWTVTPIALAWEKQKQFVADASHELKTPLAVISANTEVVLSNPEASVSGQSKWLNYIQSETMRMSKLITNLLAIARMDHNKEAADDTTLLSLTDTVSNICLQFEPIIFENGKTLNTVIQRKVTLHAEEDNIKQLLSILLDNAVLHSVPKAQITVSLSKDTQGKIRLAVSNTAKDIPPEQLSHLFDRFYRVDTEGSPNGSGLGLSIAKSIVTQMGGKISVSSENQLVTFTAVFST